MSQTTTTFTSSLQKAVGEMKITEERRVAGRLSPVEAGHARAASLADALFAAGKHFGVHLQTPIQIDGNGEVRLVAMPEDGSDPQYGCGHFGKRFADLLNQYNPRTGLAPGATLLPESGWCRMNHFDAERVVLVAAAHELQEQEAKRSAESCATPAVRRATPRAR